MVKPVCFLSHAWRWQGRDGDGHVFAISLAAALRSKGIDVWLDEERMPPGARISVQVESAIRHKCDVVVFVLSSDALLSDNCMAELSIAREAAKPVVVVRRDEDRAPDWLRDRIEVDFRGPHFAVAVERLAGGIEGLAREGRAVAVLADRDPELRIRAAQLLFERDRDTAFEALTARLALETDEHVLHWLLRLLGAIALEVGEPRRERLRRVFDDYREHESAWVRDAAESAGRAPMISEDPSRERR